MRTRGITCEHCHREGFDDPAAYFVRVADGPKLALCKAHVDQLKAVSLEAVHHVGGMLKKKTEIVLEAKVESMKKSMKADFMPDKPLLWDEDD